MIEHDPVIPLPHRLKHDSSQRNRRLNSFAMLVGGGVDLGLRKGIGFRIVQADWLYTQFADRTQDRQGRVSAGIVIKF
jgi:hypothetical protein